MSDTNGRPRDADSARRRREFLRLLTMGATCRDAAREAHISPDTVLTLLDQREFRTVLHALLDGRADAVAVTVVPVIEDLAA